MATLGKLIIDISASTSSLKAGIDAARADLGRFRQTTEAASTSLVRWGNVDVSRLRGGLTGVAAAAAGVSGPVGQVASLFGSMALGGGVTGGILAGIAAVAAAWNKLTEDTRKAREATQAWVQEQVKVANTRNSPHAETNAAIMAALGREMQLRKEIAEIQRRSAAQGLGGNLIFGPQLEKLRKELSLTADAVKDAHEAMRVSGGAFMHDLAAEVGTFGMSSIAARQYAVALNTDLTPAERSAAEALLVRLDVLGKGKKAHEDAIAREIEYGKWLERSKDAAAELNGILSKRRFEVDTGIREALTEHLDAKAKMAESSRILLDNSSFSTMVENMKNGPAKLWEKTWENAVQGAQNTLADFFSNLGQQGDGVVGLFRGIAKEIQNLFAQVAAQQVGNAIFPGLFKSLLGGVPPAAPDVGDSLSGVLHGGGLVGSGGTSRFVHPLAFLKAQRMHAGGMIGLGPDEVPIIGKRGERVLNPQETAAYGKGGGSFVMHQNVSFNVQAMDGPSVAAMLKSQAGTIAGVVAQAASDAPAFARHIIANGLR